MVTLTKNDILCGQGKHSHTGNIFYRSCVDKLFHYVKKMAWLGPKYNKENMVNNVIHAITNNHEFFLILNGEDEWVIVDRSNVEAKINQAFKTEVIKRNKFAKQVLEKYHDDTYDKDIIKIQQKAEKNTIMGKDETSKDA